GVHLIRWCTSASAWLLFWCLGLRDTAGRGLCAVVLLLSSVPFGLRDSLVFGAAFLLLLVQQPCLLFCGKQLVR
ncbi:hypothetical protein Ancab_015162, partial [Ancistrocladus abbreviatus]